MKQANLDQLLKALRSAWNQETCFDKALWNPENPARGQCVVSSLLIQDYLEGDLFRYKVKGDGINETHYCNVLDGGTILDATGQQYVGLDVILQPTPVDLSGFKSIREKRLADIETKARYELLKERVRLQLSSD